MTSDGGLLLPRELDERLGLSALVEASDADYQPVRDAMEFMGLGRPN